MICAIRPSRDFKSALAGSESSFPQSLDETAAGCAKFKKFQLGAPTVARRRRRGET